MLIDAKHLKDIAPSLTLDRAQTISDLLNQWCPNFGMTDQNDFEIFLAQVCHESSEFKNRAENLNYSTPQRLVDVWPTRFVIKHSSIGDKRQIASFFVNNPQRLANSVYANRMGNGDAASGDGYKFRGRGWLQLTGRDSYAQCAKFIGIDLINNPDLLLTDEVALRSALWEYVVNKKLLGVHDFKKVTVAINGGLIGLPNRQGYYNKVLQVLA